jgi:beta-glucosidase
VITENGAGFEGDDELKNGQVNDTHRINYLKGHIAAVQAVRKMGGHVYGYHVWSSHDNLEWISGYRSRFGMIYVDFSTQQRILKNSAKYYGSYVRAQLQKGVTK